MSRTITSAYQTHLGAETQTRALCCKVTRTDGTIMGFTSHDVDLELEGVTYEADSAVDVAALRTSVGTGVDNSEAFGALISDRITETDILAGLYDGAAVTLFEVNWASLGDGELIYLLGSLGEFTVETGSFKSELRSLAQRLSQQIVEVYSKECRVQQLFDARCFVGGTNYAGTKTAADFRSTHSVATVNSLTQFTFAGNTQASTYYRYGRVEFQSGANNGLQREIKEHALSGGQAVITLQEAFPFAVAVGDTALLEAGCDRRAETCRDRFQNKGNFRGEDFLPGTDAILVRGRR